MKHTVLLASLLALSLAGCASSGGMVGPDGAPVDLRNADVTSKTMDNGDRIDEYRVAGQVRMVKITPARGATYYLYDRDGDGHMDNDKDGVSPVYWKIYSW
jgi:hypothetical protein